MKHKHMAARGWTTNPSRSGDIIHAESGWVGRWMPSTPTYGKYGHGISQECWCIIDQDREHVGYVYHWSDLP